MYLSAEQKRKAAADLMIKDIEREAKSEQKAKISAANSNYTC